MIDPNDIDDSLVGSPTNNTTARFQQPLSDEQVWTLIEDARNSDRVVPLREGNWKESTGEYDSPEAAARAFIFDLSFYTDYRYSQVRRLFNQSGMSRVFSGAEIDDVVDEAKIEQNRRSYPTF